MSLEVFKPPTDTLYKFLAILGLLFFITSLVAPIYLAKQVHEQELDFLKDLKVLVLDAKQWQEISNDMDQLSSERREVHKQLEEASHNYIIGKIPKADVKRALERAVANSKEYETKSEAFKKNFARLAETVCLR